MSIFSAFFFLFPFLGMASGDWNPHDHSTYWFFLASFAMSWLSAAVLRRELKEKEKK